MDTSVVNAQRNSRPSSLNELQLQQTLPIDVVGTRDDTGERICKLFITSFDILTQSIISDYVLNMISINTISSLCGI